MNRKQKIIVSVTGIFIVLLILVGLTYAYFLTTIFGNTNSKSISVTTSDLKLVYGDGTGTLSPTEKIMPGTVVGTKTFTVTNSGDQEVEYVVVLEDVVNGLERVDDLVYKLECSSNCNSLVDDTKEGGYANSFPATTDVAVLVSNNIASNQVQTYTLTVKYLDPGVDQSIDMGKTFSAKINIRDSRNPYGSNTIAGTLIENSIGVSDKDNKSGIARFSATPLSKPAAAVSTINESTLSVAQDNYGTSYYYRGNVKNNYVNFAGMCFRIVRTAGDGSIRLILEDKNVTCNSSSYTGNWNLGDVAYGYTTKTLTDLSYGWQSLDVYYGDYGSATNGLKSKFTEWYNNKLTSYQSKLKKESICLGDTTKYNFSSYDHWYGFTAEAYSYDTYLRLTSAFPSSTLKCTGGNDESAYVYPITADEVVYAGAKDSTSNHNYYLLNNYQYNNDISFWTISLTQHEEDVSGDNGMIGDNAYRVADYGQLVIKADWYYVSSVALSFGARPMITLKSGTTFASGDGTRTNPYVVN